MEKLKNIPSLRFPEFDGEWENKKLGFIGDYLGGGTPKTSVQEYWKGDIPWISSSDITENDFHNINIQKHITEDAIKNSATKIIPANSLIIVSRVGVGKFAINKKIVCTSQDFTNIVIDSEIVHAYFSAYNLYKNIGILHNISQGTSIKGFTNVDLKETKLTFPTLQEQTKIASFLTAVDDKLQALKQKKTLLEQYKKGVMQKIFSQELRFKDDNGNDYPDWEEKKLGEIASFRRGSFPQPYGLPEWYDNENGYPFIQVYDVDENMLLKPNTKNKISELATKQSVFVKKGTIVITIQGSIGRIAKTQYDAYIDRTLLIFQSYKVPINIDYFKYVLFLLFEIEKTKAPGGTIKTITKEVLTEFEVSIPNIEEQTKIANFLSAIDDKINHCGIQIEKMEVWKKGLLQQMFC